jgi:PEP-CTERM motif
MRSLVLQLAAAGALTFAVAAQASVVRITEDAFTPQAGLITFSEKTLGSINPTYAPADYGGVAGAPTVTFGGFFLGQSLGTAATCPAGAALTGCVVGTPTAALSIDARSPATEIVGDAANPTSPVLSGSPTFNGAIAVLFSVDLAGVGLDGGFFDDAAGTAITAFDRNGNVIGSVTNEGTGIEFLGLVTDDGSASIAGLLFSLVGAERAGFAIDNLRFGTAGQVIDPNKVPEPATLLLVGLAVAALGASSRRRSV